MNWNLGSRLLTGLKFELQSLTTQHASPPAHFGQDKGDSGTELSFGASELELRARSNGGNEGFRGVLRNTAYFDQNT